MSNYSHNIVKNIGLTLLSEGKTIRIKASGYSMYSCIKPGSLILIEPINLKGVPRPGEIIAIRREDGLIVHRLVKSIIINGITSFIARGDSNAYADNPVMIDKIAGRIVGAETTGENPVKADIRLNSKPKYFYNRIRVIGLLLWKRFK
ncbi:MAG TPA: S24/S26 family peptidase [Bacteroidales bacterium]|nr:S24/S26 family peptidase [Bacteroidales bacterium]